MADERFEQGVAIREQMFGRAHVETIIEGADDFTEEFEDIVTRYCFAEIWGREQLPKKIRSLVTIAMLIALGRSHEIQVHVKAAIANGATKVEVREVLIHSAAYCGIPAAVDGFTNARAALEQIGITDG